MDDVQGWSLLRTPDVQGEAAVGAGIRYRIDNGGLVRKIVADTKAGAEDELEKVREAYREQQRRAQAGLTDGKTFADLTKPFLEFKEQLGREMSTLRSRVRNLTPHFGAMLLSQIDAAAIDAYVSARCTEYKMQPCRAHGNGERCPTCSQRIDKATVNRDLGVLRNMLKLAVRKWRWLDREPYLEKLPEKAGRDIELTEAEEERLVAECSPALADLIAGAIHTGMRQGELLALTWPQVDLANRLIDFPPTKRGRKRLMPINERLYYVLTRRKAAAQGMTGPQKTDRVFSRPDGPP